MTPENFNTIGMVSGRLVDPFNFQAEDINVWELAWGLSQQNRYMGNTRIAWPVLSHTGLVLQLYVQDKRGEVNIHEVVQLLLHDAAEAYISDIPRPLRHRPQFQFFDELDHHISRIIYKRFGYDLDTEVNRDMIERYDRQAIHIEHYYLFPMLRNTPRAPQPIYPVERYAPLVLGTVPQFVQFLREQVINARKADNVAALFEVPTTMEDLVSEATSPPTHHDSNTDLVLGDSRPNPQAQAILNAKVD